MIVFHSASLVLHKIIVSSSFCFPLDSWHNWSTCFKRKMDWDKWKKNYVEWRRSLHTQLCKAFTILSVCSAIANRLLLFFFWEKNYRLIRILLQEATHNICYKKLYFWANSLLSYLSSSRCGRFVVFLFSLTFALLWCRYTTSPHLFSGDAEVAFARVRSKVCPTFISFRKKNYNLSWHQEACFFQCWWMMIGVMSQETPDYS